MGVPNWIKGKKQVSIITLLSRFLSMNVIWPATPYFCRHSQSHSQCHMRLAMMLVKKKKSLITDRVTESWLTKYVRDFPCNWPYSLEQSWVYRTLEPAIQRYPMYLQYFLLLHTQPIINILSQLSPCMAKDELKLICLYPSESKADTRVHSWCSKFCGFGEMCDDVLQNSLSTLSVLSIVQCFILPFRLFFPSDSNHWCFLGSPRVFFFSVTWLDSGFMKPFKITIHISLSNIHLGLFKKCVFITQGSIFLVHTNIPLSGYKIKE